MKKALDQTVRELKREVNKKVLKVPGIEQKILDATSNEPWGPHGSLLADIAQATRNYHEYQIIMHVIWKRLNDTGKNWRHVYKALTVLEYMVGHGSERVIDEIREHAYQISTLSDFQYIDSSGKDQGNNVRRKSQILVSLVNDKEKIQEVRQKALANKDKYRATFSSSGSYRPSSNSIGSGYGDRYDDDRYENRYGNRDDDRNGYGRERDFGYKDDDRSTRAGDFYRDDDRYGRDTDENFKQVSFKDDDHRGGQANDDHQVGQRNMSFDKEKDHSYEDDDSYAYRNGGRTNDASPNERKLERKLSEQSVDAPPSYESAVRNDRDGGVERTAVSNPFTPAAHKALSPQSTIQDHHNTIDRVNSSTMGTDDNSFDEFDPRGFMPAANLVPPTASSATLAASGSDIDLFGNSLPFDPVNSLALVLSSPITSNETEVVTSNSPFGTNFVALSSASIALSQVLCSIHEMKSVQIPPVMKSGEQEENFPTNYIPTKPNKITANKNNPFILVTCLTCLQLTFVIYATFLLHVISPSDLQATLDSSLATRVNKRIMLSSIQENPAPGSYSEECQHEQIDFLQKTSNDKVMVRLKRELYGEVLEFQKRNLRPETLVELMSMKSKWTRGGTNVPKITVILNHFKRKTLCAQLDSMLNQTLPFHLLWVLSFGSPNEASLRRIVDSYNNSRISFISSSYDFKYYGRFQLALQSEADFVYILDDDMIPGWKMLEILSHVGGTDKYNNAVLGSIGRILPFRKNDFSFPSYRSPHSKEAGLYLPDPVYNITVDRIVQVDFLSSSWFLSAELVKALFVENPLTFKTGEDLHLSYQLQKYRDAWSYILPPDPHDKETWGDSEHRLAFISETTVIYKDIVQLRDDQWWRVLSSGYVTQWAKMYPQKIDALFYAHSLEEVKVFSPLLKKFGSIVGRKAYIVVSGGTLCPCEAAAAILNWPEGVCKERRFKIIDLGIGANSGISNSEVPNMQPLHCSMKGILRIHNPGLLIAAADIDSTVKNSLKMAIEGSKNNSTLVLLPRSEVSKVLWIADLRPTALPYWNRMRISVNIITQNRASSLQRLLHSLQNAFYLGDEVPLSFNIDNKVDEKTLKVAASFEWPHGPKSIRRRIVQGGLIRAVSESWYPSSDNDFGLLLEDDIEVSPYYYSWVKYVLLTYHYDPQVSLPELSSISLYTPRLIEVVKERPKWNATEFFKSIHPNTPYLHQLPCSWGAVFFPKHWREFYAYMSSRFTKDAKKNPVQIPKSRTNGWQASWKKFLIDMMYLRGYVTLYPNFPNQRCFSTNHMEPGAHISARDNVVKHDRTDFEVPLMEKDFAELLPRGKMPLANRLPVLNLFNQAVSLRGLKAAGAKLRQDVIGCNETKIVVVDHGTGLPRSCIAF